MYISPEFWNRFKNAPDEYYKYLTNIKNNIDNGVNVTYEQVTEFCSACDEKQIKKYDVCDDIRFKKIFLEYVDYHKNKGIKVKYEKREQLKYFFLQWEKVISNTRHSESLLQFISKETREQLKKLDKICKKNSKLNYDIEKRDIILLSKYIYMKVKYMFKPIPNKCKEFDFHGKRTHVDEDTLIHVFFRHYNKIVQPLIGFDKSHFTPDIPFENLIDFIEVVLKKFEYLGVVGTNFIFEFKGQNYRIYLDPNVYIQRKGHKGNIQINRVKTIYPIIDNDELMDLTQNYEEVAHEADFKFYRKKLPT